MMMHDMLKMKTNYQYTLVIYLEVILIFSRNPCDFFHHQTTMDFVEISA